MAGASSAFCRVCSPIAPSMARTRGGSDRATFSRSFEAAVLDCIRASVRLTVSSGDSSLDLPRLPQKIEQCGIGFGKVGPGLRPAGVDHRIVADEFARQA